MDSDARYGRQRILRATTSIKTCAMKISPQRKAKMRRDAMHYLKDNVDADYRGKSNYNQISFSLNIRIEPLGDSSMASLICLQQVKKMRWKLKNVNL